MKNNKGFTLIELLAVITIIGILSVTAIFAISYLTNRSRETIYANNAITFISSTRTEQFQNEENVAYVYRLSELDVTNNDRSPFADFTWGYVVCICENGSCKYYYMSLDKAGNVIGDKITDQKNNSTYITPIPAEVIQDKKGKTIIKINPENIGINNISKINNETEESKLTVIFNQMQKTYTDNNKKFSFAIGDENNYKVYTIKEYENLRFIAEENANPLTTGTVINVKVSYAPSNHDGYTNTEVRSFVVIEDNGDTVSTIMQRDLYANNSKRIGLEKKFAHFLLFNEKIKDIRLLEIDDLKAFIPNIEMYLDGNLLFPYSIIRLLNINNKNSPAKFLGDDIDEYANSTLICTKDVYTNQDIRWYYSIESKYLSLDNVKIPDQKKIDSCKIIITDDDRPSKINKITKVDAYKTHRFKLVLVFDKEAIKDEI